jgi:hypothetical protein
VTRIKVYLSTELVFENKLCSTECTNKVIKRHATPEPETLINEFQKSWTNWMRDFLYFLDADLAAKKKEEKEHGFHLFQTLSLLQHKKDFCNSI